MRPATADKLPAIIVIHENRGLNPYIEDVARRLAVANFIAFAPDGLTSLGGYPGDEEKAAALLEGSLEPFSLTQIEPSLSHSPCNDRTPDEAGRIDGGKSLPEP